MRKTNSTATVIASCLAFSLLISCSKPPVYRPGASGGSGNVIVDPNNPNNPSTPAIGDLNLTYARLSPAAFRSLLNKLAYVAGIDSKDATSHKPLAELISSRNNLGDYDYSIRKTENDLWQTDQMKLWMQSLLPFCQDQGLQQKYNLDVNAFVKVALGREVIEGDAANLLANSSLASNKKSLFEASCVAYLSSLEFRNQWPTGLASKKDYLNLVASTVVERPLVVGEVEAAKSPEELIKKWVDSDRFVEASRQYVERLMKTNGKVDDIDFDLPGNLMAHIVNSKAPFSQIITSDMCYSRDGKSMPCDSGAPFGAGVLTTRAVMKATAGAYSIARSNFVLKTFSCLSYPMAHVIEPRAPKESLIPYFAATDGKGFGNGSDCYSCHSQFGKHAQLFVKFDFKGLYQNDASGLQVDDAGPGHSKNGLFVSHFSDPEQAASEKSEYFGKPVENLKEAAKVIAENDNFIPCAVNRVLFHFLRIKEDEASNVPSAIIKDITANIRAESKDPSFQQIVTKTLGNEKLIKAFSDMNEAGK